MTSSSVSLLSDFINGVKKGINTTIFAYGQTGSGKTYTMFGRDWTTNEGVEALHSKKYKT